MSAAAFGSGALPSLNGYAELYKPRKAAPSPKDKRFWRFVDRRGDDECWPWTGSLSTEGGYAQITVVRNGVAKVHRAHRVSWEIHNGRSIPRGMLVRHSCDNAACVNPHHLSIGEKESHKNKRNRVLWSYVVVSYEDGSQVAGPFDRREEGRDYIRERGAQYTLKVVRHEKRGIPLTVNGETLPLSVWANRAGIHINQLKQRLRCGWPVGSAVTIPRGGKCPGIRRGRKPKSYAYSPSTGEKA